MTVGFQNLYMEIANPTLNVGSGTAWKLAQTKMIGVLNRVDYMANIFTSILSQEGKKGNGNLQSRM